jgi:hypothetical protein
MTNDRPPIPTALRRRVLVEAGHRCAIPTCRYIDVDVHHIIPWETCRKHEYENLIALCPNCHRRAGQGEIDRKSLRLYKANLRFAHDKFSQFELDMLFELARLPLTPEQAVLFPPFLNLLIKRLLDAGYVVVRKNPHGSAIIFGLETAPGYLQITDKGREFVASLSLDSGN